MVTRSQQSIVESRRFLWLLLLSTFNLQPSTALPQQPATQPLFSVNAKGVQGVGPGSWPYGAVVPIYVATTGNDSTGAGTVGNPYLTIGRALQDVPVFVSQQYVIHLAAGTYYGEVDVTGRYFGTVANSLYKAAITFQGSTAVTPATAVLSSVASGALAGATYYVRVAYTNSAGETEASTESSLAIAVNHVVSVASPAASGDATGYNVYVSTTTGTETKQNGGTPIAIGVAWQEPNTGLVAGAALPVADTMGDAYVISGATSGAPTTPTSNEAINCTNANCILQGVSAQYGVFAGLYVLGGNAVTYNSTYRHMNNSTAFDGNSGDAVLVRNFGTLELAGDTVISDSWFGVGVFDFGQVESNVTGFDIFGTGWPVNGTLSISMANIANGGGVSAWDRGYFNVAGTTTITGTNAAGQIGVSAHEGMVVTETLNVSTVPIAVRSEASAEVYADFSTFTSCAVGWSVRDLSVGNMYEADTTFTSVATPYDIANGAWVIRGNTNFSGPTQNQFDGDLETPAGKNITLKPGTGGLVGIGTGSPNRLVDIEPATRNTAYNASDLTTWADALLFNNSTTSGAATGIALQLGSAYNLNGGGGIAVVKNSSSDKDADLVFITRPLSAASAERMRIRRDGNVGIGDTNPGQAFSVFGKFLVNSSGVATTYNNVALGGNGQPYMPSGGVVDLTAQAASIGATALFTPSANGLFRISYYLTTTTAGSAGTVTVTFTWTDEAKAETFTSTALSLTALGALAPPQPLVIYAKTTAAIQYSTTVSGATGSPQYSLHIRVEAL